MISNGVHFNQPRHIYDAIKAVNWSTAKIVWEQSPAHYKHAVEHPGSAEDTDARVLGRAFHTAALEPELYKGAFDVWRGDKVRQPKEWKKFLGDSIFEGREVLTVDQDRDVRAMAASARACPAANALGIWRGGSEVSMTWTFEREVLGALEGYTIDCKGRLDKLTEETGAIVDLKSTLSAKPDDFAREVAAYGYHLQAAMYQHGYAIASNTGRLAPYYLLAVEKKPPYVAQVFELDQITLQVGWSALLEVFDQLNHARRTGIYPSYFDGVMTLELPRYAMPSEDDF